MVWWIPRSAIPGTQPEILQNNAGRTGTQNIWITNGKKYVDAINEIAYGGEESEQDRIYERAGKAASDFCQKKILMRLWTIAIF